MRTRSKAEIRMSPIRVLSTDDLAGVFDALNSVRAAAPLRLVSRSMRVQVDAWALPLLRVRRQEMTAAVSRRYRALSLPESAPVLQALSACQSVEFGVWLHVHQDWQHAFAPADVVPELWLRVDRGSGQLMISSTSDLVSEQLGRGWRWTAPMARLREMLRVGRTVDGIFLQRDHCRETWHESYPHASGKRTEFAQRRMGVTVMAHQARKSWPAFDVVCTLGQFCAVCKRDVHDCDCPCWLGDRSTCECELHLGYERFVVNPPHRESQVQVVRDEESRLIGGLYDAEKDGDGDGASYFRQELRELRELHKAGQKSRQDHPMVRCLVWRPSCQQSAYGTGWTGTPLCSAPIAEVCEWLKGSGRK